MMLNTSKIPINKNQITFREGNIAFFAFLNEYKGAVVMVHLILILKPV